MSEGDPLISEVSSGKLDTPKDSPKSPNKGILDGLRRKFVLAAGIGLASGALGGAFGTQGCAPAESDSDEHGHNEKVGSVKQAIWQDPSSEPSWGQDSAGSNASPFVYWKDANNGVAVFASNKPGGLGGHDIYVSTTSAGPDGPWTPETPIDDSLSAIKVNTVGEQTSAVICVGGNCGTGKFFVSSVSQVYEGDFDLSTLQVSNLTKLPTGPTKVNAVGGGSYLSVDAAGTKLYWSNSTKVFVADIDVNPADATKWTRTEITGFLGTTNGSPTVWGSHIMVSALNGCENIGGAGDLDLCQYDLTGTTVSNHYNANVVPGSLAIPNTAQDQITPMVDTKGILWYASRESGPLAKIKRKDPKVVVVPDAGPDGSGGEGGAGGADGGTDSGAGGDGGTGGSDAGTDVDAGMDAAVDAPDDVMDAGVDAPDDAMDASTDAGDAGEGGADSGPTDAGMPDADAGTSDAGEDAGMDAGPTDAGTDAPVDSGMDASTDAGEGGADAGPKPDCKVKVSGGSIESCNDTSAIIKMTGIGSISFFDVKADITEVVGDSCTYTVEFPNVIKLTSGFCAKELSEPKTAAVKYVDSEMGITLGAEGSRKSTTAPDAFNPNKKKGVVDVVAFKAVESVHHAFKADGCDEHNLTTCTPMNTNIEGAAQRNDIPEGSILYLNVKDGIVSGNPNTFKNAPSAAPVEASDGGGCNMSAENVSHDTRNAIFVLIGGMLVAVRRSRRERK